MHIIKSDGVRIVPVTLNSPKWLNLINDLVLISGVDQFGAKIEVPTHFFKDNRKQISFIRIFSDCIVQVLYSPIVH